MNIHKLNAERSAVENPAAAIGLNLHHRISDFADSVVKTRALRSIENIAAKYPIYRRVRCASTRNLYQIFDDLALHSGLSACRLWGGLLLLDGAGVFVEAEGWHTTGHTSCAFNIWSESVARLEETREKLLRIIGDTHPRSRMFTLAWHYMNQYGLDDTSFDELATDVVHDEAYPTLGVPVREFIGNYLRADETVLVLLGSPGTGKTKLVRSILGALSERKQDSAQVIYTADKRALEHDEIFVKFITRAYDALVIEDADHMLLARSDGNHDLHRFLAIADGVVRAAGRKIIFTTNLPNVTDVDEALLRPGRCYASVSTRPLNRDQAAALLRKLSEDHSGVNPLLSSLFASGVRGVSVAEVYRACGATRRPS
ncbi:MAG: ATP-binding protein [Steroidobacter sp.]